MIKDVVDTAINALDDFELKTFPQRVIAIPTGKVAGARVPMTERSVARDFATWHDRR